MTFENKWEQNPESPLIMIEYDELLNYLILKGFKTKRLRSKIKCVIENLSCVLYYPMSCGLA